MHTALVDTLLWHVAGGMSVSSDGTGHAKPGGRRVWQALPLRSVALLLCALGLVLSTLAGCAGIEPALPSVRGPEPVITITLLQMNDVYEITPVAGGASGGLARVATLRKQLLAHNPHTYTVLAGDLFSPSALGTAKVDGTRLDGKQMVAVLNTLGLDYATFGNHEFDLEEGPFLQRLAEATFQWVSSNVVTAQGQPFPAVMPHRILTIEAPSKGTVRLGLIAATIDSNPKAYVRYKDALTALRQEAEVLKDRVDILVALTHLALEQDIEVAETIPGINLILGGHEHDNWHVQRGQHFTPILKADANARSVYIHELRYHTQTRTVHIDSRLQRITDALPEDPATAAVVQHWVDRAFVGFTQAGFNPTDVVTHTTVPLDGREASIRNHATLLTDLVATALLQEAHGSEVAIYNSGAIRIDDVLPPGQVTQYDVIRLLPFGGTVLTVAMTGDLLAQTLTQGMANRGSGGFLHTANVSRPDGQTWVIGTTPLARERTYTVAINDFLVSGRETNLGFLHLDGNPNLTLVSTHRDIRKVLIDQLQRHFGAP